MENEERITMLETAQQQIREATGLLIEAVSGTEEEGRAYGVTVAYLTDLADGEERCSIPMIIGRLAKREEAK